MKHSYINFFNNKMEESCELKSDIDFSSVAGLDEIKEEFIGNK